MSTASSEMTPAPDPATSPPEGLATRILKVIPVVTTLLATLLAGLSSSEMTQAQYHRSLAAQYQSKAADQWSFFQAKRQRGYLASLLDHPGRVRGVPPTQRDMLAYAAELRKECPRVVLKADNLVRVLEKTSPAASDAVARAAAEFLESARKLTAPQAQADAKQLEGFILQARPLERARQAAEEVRHSLLEELASLSPDVPRSLEAVASQASDEEIGAILSRLSPEQLHESIKEVQLRAMQYEALMKGPLQAHRNIGRSVERQVNGLRTLHATSRSLADAWDDLPAGQRDQAAAVRRAILGARHAVERAADLAEELSDQSRKERNEFRRQRYTLEGTYNQLIAELYELLVRKSSLASEQHRRRSYLFFYAMLVAQGGVTLATFALAVRQMSALWGLATLAGLCAMGVGVYVYLFI